MTDCRSGDYRRSQIYTTAVLSDTTGLVTTNVTLTDVHKVTSGTEGQIEIFMFFHCEVYVSFKDIKSYTNQNLYCTSVCKSMQKDIVD